MRWLILTLCLLMAAPAQAVQPDEVLADPLLEQRARVLSKELRCLVCRNESIDDSNAELARDLRLLVRERLLAGDTNDEVMTYIVARYGEYVRLQPVFSVSNAPLWFAGPLIFLLGLGVAVVFIRRRSQAVPAELSADEKARLEQLLKD